MTTATRGKPAPGSLYRIEKIVQLTELESPSISLLQEHYGQLTNIFR
jgi:hypothetical protein